MILQQCSEKKITPVCLCRTDRAISLLCDVIRGRLMPQLHDDIPDAIYQQDRVPPHLHNKGTTYIDELRKLFIRCQGLTEWPQHNYHLSPQAVLLLRDGQGRRSTRAEDRHHRGLRRCWSRYSPNIPEKCISVSYNGIHAQHYLRQRLIWYRQLVCIS